MFVYLSQPQCRSISLSLAKRPTRLIIVVQALKSSVILVETRTFDKCGSSLVFVFRTLPISPVL